MLNALKVIISFNISKIIKKPVVWGMPVSYSIEPTNHCNLSCPECPSGTGALTRPLGMLKLDAFKSIIDEIKSTGFYIQLFFQGEPFLNKHLPEMISYARENNVYSSISTHGLLINKKTVEKIIENSPNKIIFSLDGLDEASYQNYRVGGTFKKADESLRLLINKKKEEKKSRPFVELQFIVMKQNEHLLDEVKKYAKDVGVDKIVFKTMQVSSFENAKKYLPKSEKYSRYRVTKNNYHVKSKLRNYCFALWRTSVITWDGRVVPCCFDKDAENEIDKMNGNKLVDIWSSTSYNNFRQQILSNRKGIKMCTNCTEGLKVNLLEIEN